MTSLLVVDDNQDNIDSFKDLVKAKRLPWKVEGYHVQGNPLSEDSFTQLHKKIEQERPDYILHDVALGKAPTAGSLSELKANIKGLEWVRDLRNKLSHDTSYDPIIFAWTAYNTGITDHLKVKLIIQAIQMGANDILFKDFNDEIIETISALGQNIRNKKALIKRENGACGLIGTSHLMQEVFEAIYQVSPSKANVLLRGESGTGKELVAKAIHFMSSRAKKSFIKFNCASIPEGLLESELFGHEKGSFTGAATMRRGRFELADNGTIFLDEIGDLPMTLQPKILRVLQEKEFERVGGEKTIKVDVRVVAATSRDLEDLVIRSGFREDLYYRLNVVPISLPALRERREDIPLLQEHFLKIYNTENSKNVQISPDVLNIFMSYDWPGNVRELENTIERLVVMSKGKVVSLADLPANIRQSKTDCPSALEDIQKAAILDALKKTKWVRVNAARRLGIALRSLIITMKKYGIDESTNHAEQESLPSSIAKSENSTVSMQSLSEAFIGNIGQKEIYYDDFLDRGCKALEDLFRGRDRFRSYVEGTIDAKKFFKLLVADINFELKNRRATIYKVKKDGSKYQAFGLTPAQRTFGSYGSWTNTLENNLRKRFIGLARGR